jgi:hypothetical protein
MNAQNLRDASMSTYMKPETTLEINLTHPVVKKVIKKIVEQTEANTEDKSTKDMIYLL